MSLMYTKAIHRLFMEAVENVCCQHLVFGIKEIREYRMGHLQGANWIIRKDVVLKDGRIISVRVVIEDGCFLIEEKRIKEESGRYVDSIRGRGWVRENDPSSGDSEGSGV